MEEKAHFHFCTAFNLLQSWNNRIAINIGIEIITTIPKIQQITVIALMCTLAETYTTSETRCYIKKRHEADSLLPNPSLGMIKHYSKLAEHLLLPLVYRCRFRPFCTYLQRHTYIDV